MLLMGIVLSGVTTSCYIEPRNPLQDIIGNYSIDGYIYPLGFPHLHYQNYYNLTLSIDWYSNSRVYVSIYDRYNYINPFYNMPCNVTYDYREDAYVLSNYEVPEMMFYIYPGGYVYLDFPYVWYNNRDCGYFFSNY